MRRFVSEEGGGEGGRGETGLFSLAGDAANALADCERKVTGGCDNSTAPFEAVRFSAGRGTLLRGPQLTPHGPQSRTLCAFTMRPFSPECQ